jgi:Skp family chaperone for outer membrane proteins
MSQNLRVLALMIAAAAVVVCLPARGTAQDARIALVDTQELTLMSDEGKVANEKLQKRFLVIQAEMDKLRKDIEAKEEGLRTRERLLSASAKAQHTREIEDDNKKFERKSEDYQKEMNDMQVELIDPVARKVRTELQTFVGEKGYTILVDLSAENGNIVWFNPNNEITKEVMVRINENFKRSGGAAAAAPAATPAAKPPTTTTPAATTPAPTTQPAPAGQRPAGGPTTTPPASNK